MEERRIAGGQNEVLLKGQAVHRPSHPWSLAVRTLLERCRQQGLDFIPKWLGVDEDGNEVFEYLEGEVGHYPLPDFLKSDEAIISAGKTLRAFHDATTELARDTTLKWQFEPIEPVEVVCHGDFASYNCVFQNSAIKGVIDFDGARPGPRRWDLSYAAYRFVPFLNFKEQDDGFGSLDDRLRRLEIFIDAYGESPAEAAESVKMIPARLKSLVNWMFDEAAAGNVHCQRSLQERHHDLYLRDIDAISELVHTHDYFKQ